MDSAGSRFRSPGSAHDEDDKRATLARHPGERISRSTTLVAFENITRGRLPPPPVSVVLDLSLVDSAFGPKSDLYWDVLRVKPDASPKQIRRAYFQRRDELFKLLSDLDEEEALYEFPESRSSSHARSSCITKARRDVDRKMNGIVMAIRILDDPVARQRYDSVRMDRLLRPNASLSQSLKDFVSEYRLHDTIRSETMAVLADIRKSESIDPSSRKILPELSRKKPELICEVPAGTNATCKAVRRKSQVVDLLWLAKSSSTEGRAAITVPGSPMDHNKTEYNSGSSASPYLGQQKRQITKAAAADSRNQIRERWTRFDKCDAYHRSDYVADDDDDGFDARSADITWTDQGTVVSEVASDLTTSTVAGAWSRGDYDTHGIVTCLSNELCGAMEIMAARSGQVFDILALQEEDERSVRYRSKSRQQASNSLDRHDQNNGKQHHEDAARASTYHFRRKDN